MNSRLNAFVMHGLIATAAFATTPLLHAANSAAPESAAPPVLNLAAAVSDPIRDLRYQPAGMSSSSDAADSSVALDAERDSLGDAGAQPPPGRRRSYGRSRYQDRLHNADGSNKIAVVVGAGLNLPVANTGKFYTPSYTITAGAGINFNKMFGVLGEFHYDHMNLTNGSLNYQYANYIANYGALPSDLVGLDANAHVIGLTVNPVVNFSGSNRDSRLGAYLTGGVGFYHKSTNFTLPEAVQSYYYTYVTAQNIETYSANGFGVNGGFGLTYKLGEFSSSRLFLEARYHWIDIGSNSNADAFPYNRRNTEYIPVTFGVRF